MDNNRKARRIIGGAIAVAVSVLLLGTLVRKRARDNQEKYRADSVDRGDVTMTVTATGTLSAVTTVQVGSQVSGIISRLYADFNSAVRKGQLLAELDPTAFEAQMEQRQADLLQAEVQTRNAEIQFNRQKRLLQEGLAAQADFDSATANYDAARAHVDQTRAALRQAETNLRYTKISSPIDGVVVDRQYDVGQTVAASFQAPTLFTIAQDLTKMQAQADVDESDIGRVQMGQAARFTVDAYPEQEFRGRISQVRLNARVNQNVITYPVIIEVANPGERLRPRMTANVTIEVSTVRDVLRIPNAALRFRPESGPEEGRGSEGQGSRGAEGQRGREAGKREGKDFERGAAEAREGGKGYAGMMRQFDRAMEAGRRPSRDQTVYLLAGPKKLKLVAVRTGISDGRYTQIVEGEIKEGDRVVVGMATLRVDQGTGRPPGMATPRGPGMGRF